MKAKDRRAVQQEMLARKTRVVEFSQSRGLSLDAPNDGAAGDGRLLSEDEAITILGLGSRPNPRGALRWLMRVRKLPYVRLARGVNGFLKSDLEALISACRVA